MSGKQEYDLIGSLGGNCAVSHNLLCRNLRPYALPFDWTYFSEDKTNDVIDALIDGFKTNFKKYMQKENLVELPINKAHKDRIQYFDNYGKIIWANHFSHKLDENNEYNIVKTKFDRRFQRLNTLINNSNKILFLFCTGFNINEHKFVLLASELKKLYNDKQIEIKVISFDNKKDENIKIENLEIMRYKRNLNEYDFIQTNYEWSFLDNISLCKNCEKSTNKQTFNIKKIKKGFFISCFPNINTIFYSYLYFLGLRIYIHIGKKRDIAIKQNKRGV